MSPEFDYDVVIVGAGFGGIAALYRLRERGLRVRLIETGGGVGGTWYWNRYPGARVDIESLEYSFDLTDELQQEWRWPERYSAQPDVQRYMRYVVDRLDLARDMQLHTRLDAAVFEPDAGGWSLTTVDLRAPDEPPIRLRARHCILATGFLSTPVIPDIPGLSEFGGRVLHTGTWPDEEIDLTGRVGVIGTGASGVQVVQTLAAVSERLTVFQRTANWCVPLWNEPLRPDYEAYVKQNYAEVRRMERELRGPGMVLMNYELSPPETRKTFDVSDEERERDYENRWRAGGIHIGRSFVDLMRDEAANDTLRTFMERKIRAQVDDPALADLLVPTHPVLSRRPPGEQGYYAAFNRDNVELVDIRSDPIDTVTREGVRLASGATHPLDVLVCATGFDAGGGAAKRIDVRGRGGRSLREYWAEGVRTHLGLMVSGFPNLYLINGPQSPSAHYLPPLLAEYQARYIADLIDRVGGDGARCIEPTERAEAQWIEDVAALYDMSLIAKTDSWWVSSNIPGKPRQAVAWAGGFLEYRRRCVRAVDGGHQEFVIDSRADGIGR